MTKNKHASVHYAHFHAFGVLSEKDKKNIFFRGIWFEMC